MTKEEKAIEEAALTQQLKKFGKNSSESAQALQYKLGFVVGAKSQAAKEYWQKGMYSEEEVKGLCRRIYHYGFSGGMNESTCSASKSLHNVNSWEEWFNRNKKK